MKRFLLLSVIIIAAVGIGLYLSQDQLLFRSDALEKSYVFKFDQPYEEYNILTSDGQTINILWFKPSGESKGLIFYFHGNANNLQRWGNYAVDLTHHGYEVVMMDYRGYGKSSGSPSEQNLHEDAELLYRWALTKTALSKIIIYGRSLGTPIATKLAASVQPELLILETPFDELKGAAPAFVQPLLSIFPMRYKFPTKDYLVQVKSRKVIFHGTHDRVVPIGSALRLRPFLKDGDEFIIIPNGTHRNLRTFEEYQLKLAEILLK